MSYISGPDIQETLPEFNIEASSLKKIYECLKRNDDNLALVEGWSGLEVSFKQLLQKSCGVASALKDLEVGQGDYVLLCCEKSVTSFFLLLGSQFTGATVILYPIPHVDRVPELVHGKEMKVVFSDPEYSDVFFKSVAELEVQPLVIATTDPEDEALQPFLQPKEEFDVYVPEDPRQHVPLILYSSGTTGVPKAIQVSDVGFQYLGTCLKKDSRKFFIASPFYWLSTSLMIVSSAYLNLSIVLSNNSDVKTNLEMLKKYEVSEWFAGSGSMTKYINEPTLDQYDLSNFKRLAVAGESVLSCISRDFYTKVLRGNVPMDIMYGSTEMGMVSTYTIEGNLESIQPGVCGTPNAGIEVKIVDESGAVVPVGCLGELFVRGPAQTPGYWERPDLTAQAFDDEGFFKSGDAGFIDSEGLMHLRGRKSDLIEFRDTKVSSIDCEDILMSHPAVFDVAVVGRPHPTDNQHLTAFVVKIPGCDVTEQQLQQLVDSKVQDHLRLRGGVHFIEALPRTIIGKVQRKLLREMPIKNM